MSTNFQGAKVRRRSFVGENLSGSNFSKADIRGVNFSQALLVGANFQEAKVGISPLWSRLLVTSLLLLTVVTGLIISYASVLVIIPLKDSPFISTVEISLSFIIAIALMSLIIKRGLGATLGAWCITVAAMLPVMIALTQENQGEIVLYMLFKTVVLSLGLAGVIAGVVTSSIIIAIRLAIFNKFVLVSIFCVAFLGSFLGITLGVSTAETKEPLVWIFSMGLTLLAFLVSTYIGYCAHREDPKFSLIQSLSIFIVTLKGTTFQGADLTEADFTQANLKCTNFSSANLTRTCWFQSKGLEQSLTKGTYLANSALRRLVVSGQGQDQKFDYQNLRGLNLKAANLTDASFIGADLSNADLSNADLSRAKLVQAQLYNTRFNRACLTGAYIQDWGISLDTQFDRVKCDYVYMHLPTPEDPDPCRKPDNRSELFKPGDFADFITPIVKTLDLYRRQNVDLRVAAKNYKTIDLFHHEGIDPSAAAIALKRLAKQHPEAGLEVIALEGRGNDKIRLQARISAQANPSELSQEYFEEYSEIQELAYGDLQALMKSIEEKDSRIRSLENMVTTAIQQKSFYVETYQNMGDTVTEKSSSINISAEGDIGSLSGIVSGNVSDSSINASTNTEAKKSILILAANPRGTSQLRLDEEVREIQIGLERSRNREQFNLEQRWAITPKEVRRALLNCEPQIVHFSGHGLGNTEDDTITNQSRKLVSLDNLTNSSPEGLMLENEQGQPQLISGTILASLFKVFADDIECVVLNACYSEVQANAIVQHISYVIGMSREIGDRAAIEFSIGFYDGLLAGQSIEKSYALGCNAIQLAGIPEHLTPILKHKA